MNEEQKIKRPLILIVDDEKNFLDIVSTKLKAVGFEVAVARNGKEAIKSATELVPELILMDIHMPDETGTDIALTIKQNPKTKDVKIAFLTALKEPWPAIAGEREKVAKEMGMEDYIEKTQDLNVMVEKVKAILTK